MAVSLSSDSTEPSGRGLIGFPAATAEAKYASVVVGDTSDGERPASSKTAAAICCHDVG